MTEICSVLGGGVSPKQKCVLFGSMISDILMHWSYPHRGLALARANFSHPTEFIQGDKVFGVNGRGHDGGKIPLLPMDAKGRGVDK